MNIIKLNAINSTNDYLKNLTATRHVDNLTVVVAENQTGGRGQMGSVWSVEAGKNLTFSVLVKDLLLEINAIFSLNAAVAISVAQALEAFSIPEISIKWPNDILAGNKKIGGILIENIIKNNGEILSVAGIGLNVNQINFEGLPKASSLRLVTGREFDINILLDAIVGVLKRNIALLLRKDIAPIWDVYNRLLFKKDIPMPFEGNSGRFMGIIKGVTTGGSLELLLENDTVAHYGIKEVQMLY